MGVASSKSKARARRVGIAARGLNEGRLALFALTSCCACSLDFDVAGRQFDCPPEVTGCLACNPDGTCREAIVVAQNDPLPRPAPSSPPEPPLPASDAGPSDAPAPAPALPPSPDAGAQPSLPTAPEECAEFGSRTSDSLCLNGERCFSLGNVLSPSLMAWLDPTTLPRAGSRLWCDRSGKGHHAVLLPDGAQVLVDGDERTAGAALARSLTLDGGWLSLQAGAEPVLRPGNFAVVIAAATPLAASDGSALDLFESGAGSTINLSVTPEGKAVGRITSLETALVRDPVVTASSIYDGLFHLYTLYRRSEVRVLDDVLQLRLNGVLEIRGSSIAIPRALDLSSPEGPLIGGSSDLNGVATSGRGRVAAVVILRGSIPEDELARLENFLCQELAVCNAPGPRLDTPPPQQVDGGS
jgi:hypothetical protein